MAIVVGVDGSPGSEHALRWALDEGRLRRTVVRAVCACPVGDDARVLAECWLAETVAAAGGDESVEQAVAFGHPAEVLAGEAKGAELLVVGSRGRGGFKAALLGSVSEACARHAPCPVVVIRGSAKRAEPWNEERVMAGEIAQDHLTWELLERLGVAAGTELRLAFSFESGGDVGDNELARFLRGETDYDVEVDETGGGVSGMTRPMPVSRSAVDEWVARMVIAGHEHGGCDFAGWTATVPGSLVSTG